MLIVERHQRVVYQFCFRFVRRHEDAADLTQEVFLRAYRGLRRFRGDATLATWLLPHWRERVPEQGVRAQGAGDDARRCAAHPGGR